jgi:hypothetical protein
MRVGDRKRAAAACEIAVGENAFAPGVAGGGMGLLRWGMLCFGVGLFVASVAGVASGVTLGCTEVACENPQPAFAVTGVSLSGVAVFDGCNTCAVNPAVGGGVALSLVGVVVGGVGVVEDLRSVE